MPTSQLTELLGLSSRPVAIAFVAAAPAGVPPVSRREPAGCGYWRRAAAGEVFYTVADDHKSCPVGAHTHNVPLSPPEKQELMGLVGTMVGLEYLKMEDVPQIPTRKSPLQVAVYAPLEAAPVAPDVVLIRGNARQLMLLAEAAQSAGVAGSSPPMGRPTCSVVPEAINAQSTAASFGCIGNRVYTGAPDDEAYFAVPGDQVRAVEERLAVIIRANTELEKFHRARAGSAPAA
ncbi:MAG TPA: DUF169 domain-containing protein [Gemmataceae bacterium]|nr:DUF169 domain-containing protein [Gemmataceae bacterium]